MSTSIPFYRIRSFLSENPRITKTVLIGFDGFIDEIKHVVHSRQSSASYIRENFLSDYGQRIVDAAGESMNVEFIPVRTKIGGNGPILANSLLHYDIPLKYIGCCGFPEIHPLYSDFASKADVCSLSDPAVTQALEFLDGKIICSELKNLDSVTWEHLIETLGLDCLTEILYKTDILGFENWTMLIHLSDIWDHILKDILSKHPVPSQRKQLLIDLADPQKRPKSDILLALKQMVEFEKYYRVTLGLNVKEARLLLNLLSNQQNEYESMTELAEKLHSLLPITEIVMHSTKEVAAVCASESVLLTVPYCSSPIQTTGAGDNFNAGFLLGKALDRDLSECVALGIANAGFYIRTATNADFQALANFFKQWENGIISL